MKRRLARLLRRWATRLDPPPPSNLTVSWGMGKKP